jgi:carbon storage regulator
MLVLSRRKNENVVIQLPDGTEIKVFVIDFRWDKVRLGFEAPRNIVVDRSEVSELRRKREEEAGKAYPGCSSDKKHSDQSEAIKCVHGVDQGQYCLYCQRYSGLNCNESIEVRDATIGTESNKPPGW